MLRYVNSTKAPQRAHEVLQELRDISSMAMEYFDEKIVPILKRKLPGSDVSGRLIAAAPGSYFTFSDTHDAASRNFVVTFPFSIMIILCCQVSSNSLPPFLQSSSIQEWFSVLFFSVLSGIVQFLEGNTGCLFFQQ